MRGDGFAKKGVRGFDGVTGAIESGDEGRAGEQCGEVESAAEAEFKYAIGWSGVDLGEDEGVHGGVVAIHQRADDASEESGRMGELTGDKSWSHAPIAKDPGGKFISGRANLHRFGPGGTTYRLSTK